MVEQVTLLDSNPRHKCCAFGGLVYGSNGVPYQTFYDARIEVVTEFSTISDWPP